LGFHQRLWALARARREREKDISNFIGHHPVFVFNYRHNQHSTVSLVLLSTQSLYADRPKAIEKSATPVSFFKCITVKETKEKEKEEEEETNATQKRKRKFSYSSSSCEYSLAQPT
jgi:hypothetical protein